MSFKTLIDPLPPAYLHVPRWYLFAHPIFTSSQDRAKGGKREKPGSARLYSNAPGLLSLCPECSRRWGGPAGAPSVAGDGTRPTAAGTRRHPRATAPPRRPRARLRAASPLGLPASREPRARSGGRLGLRRRCFPRRTSSPRPPFPRARPPGNRGSRKHACPRQLVPKASATVRTRNRKVTVLTDPSFFFFECTPGAKCVCGGVCGIHRKPRNRTARIHRFQRTHPVGLRAGPFSSIPVRRATESDRGPVSVQTPALHRPERAPRP